MGASGRLSAGEIFDRAFSVTFGRGRAVALIYSLTIVPYLVIATFVEPQTLYSNFLNWLDAAARSAGSTTHLAPIPGPSQGPAWAGPAADALSFFLIPLSGVAAVRAASQALDGQTIDVPACLRDALRRTARLLGFILAWGLVALAVAIALSSLMVIAALLVLSLTGSFTNPTPPPVVGNWFVAIAGVILVLLVLSYPIALMLFSWSFVAMSLDAAPPFAAPLRSFASLFRRRIFWRCVAIGAGAITISLFINGLEFAGSALALGPLKAPWLECTIGAVGDVIVASVSTVAYAVFFLDTSR